MMHRCQHPNGSNGSSAYVSAILVPFNKAVLLQIRLYIDCSMKFPDHSFLNPHVRNHNYLLLLQKQLELHSSHQAFSLLNLVPFFKSSENTFYVHHICSLTCLYLDFISFLDAKFSALQLFGFFYHHYSCVSLFLCFVFCLFYLYYLGYLCWGRELYYLK